MVEATWLWWPAALGLKRLWPCWSRLFSSVTSHWTSTSSLKTSYSTVLEMLWVSCTEAQQIWHACAMCTLISDIWPKGMHITTHGVKKLFTCDDNVFLFSLCILSSSSSSGPRQFKWNSVLPSIPSLSLRTMQKSGRSSSSLVPPRDSFCRLVNAGFAMTRRNTLSITAIVFWQTVCFVTRCPADPEGGGLFALRRHRHHFPAAGWGDLEPPLLLQLHPPGCDGTWTRGATHWLVQPFCTPPVLWQNWGQLRGHAHEYDTAQGKIFSGMIW